MTVLFHGSALCDVDAEGNVAIPQFLTDALDDGADLLVSKHGAEGCLIGYGRTHLKTLQARTEARRVADEARGEDARAHYRRARRTFGIAGRMPRDGSQIHIPAVMRHLGRIDRVALFVGTGDSFEIWNPDLAIESEDEPFRDLARFMVETRANTNHLGEY